MDEEIYEKYKTAGKIAAKAREHGAGIIKAGVGYYTVACGIEDKIRDMGAGLAFPVNISVNDVAAHFTPKYNDPSVFKNGDVVKLDVGAHIDGYIADTATTVEIKTNKYSKLIRSVKKALDDAIRLIREDIPLIEIGGAIENAIQSDGYVPIDNLTGHSLKRYVLHAGLSIPNVSDKKIHLSKPQVDDVLAIEPFATNGAGHVVPGASSNIYRYIGKTRFLRDLKNLRTLKNIKSRFNTLPFAERWCVDFIPNTEMVMKKLYRRGCVKQYPKLIDAKNGIVAQAEHTVIVRKNDCEVIT